MSIAFRLPVDGVLHPQGWVRPAGNIEYVVTRTCADHRATKQGCALDIGHGECGGTVRAVASGRVSYIDLTQGIVHIDHGTHDGHAWRSDYAHMRPVLVKVGQQVSVSQHVGELGDAHDPAITNFAGCHLHFALVRDGVEVDPWPLLDHRAMEEEMEIIERLEGKVAHIRGGIPLKHRPSTSRAVLSYFTTPAGGADIYPFARVGADPGGAYNGGDFLAYVSLDGADLGFGFVPDIYATLEDVTAIQATARNDNLIRRIGDANDGILQAARQVNRLVGRIESS